MAWEEDLFATLDDLEQQAEAAFGRERAGEVAERARAEYRHVTLASRLMATLGGEVSLVVASVGAVRGRLRRVGADWCLVRAAGSDWVIPLAALEVVRGAADRSVPQEAWSVADTLGVAAVLRRLADALAPCVLHTRTGERQEGVIVRVGKDFVELTAGVRHRTVPTVLVATAAVVGIQSAPDSAE